MTERQEKKKDHIMTENPQLSQLFFDLVNPML